MKKGSGFEKFHKGRAKTGAAKKEDIRKDKRVERKEREEKIAESKRQKRAQYKPVSGNEPPKYNLEPPGKRSSARPSDRNNKPTYKGEKRKIDIQPKSAKANSSNSFKPYKKDDKPLKPHQSQSAYSSNRPLKAGPRNEAPDKREPKKEWPSKDGKRKEEPRREIPRKDDPQRNRPQRDEPRKEWTKREGPHKKVQKKIEPVKRRVDEPITKPSLVKAADITVLPHEREDLMPLNKFIAHSGVCSRRDAVALIKGGKVKVNGALILEPGHKVAVTDDIKMAGRKLDPVRDFVYILLNKPKDYITTTDDPQERKTVLDLLKDAPKMRIYPVGRLDRNTSGVLLLTNDGDLSQKLTHPSNEVKKIYAVTLDKPLTKNHFESILQGVPLEDGIAHVHTLAFTDAGDLTQIGVELHTGRNRIVRRIFEHYGYDVKALDRVSFAGLTKKNVNRGKWRYLSEKEVRDLKFFKKGKK